MVDEIDSDGNGEIDFDGAPSVRPMVAAAVCLSCLHTSALCAPPTTEFVTVMSRKVNTAYTPAQVKGAFKVFERDCPSGFVSMAALEQALTTYGSEKLSLNDAQELLSQIEPDDSGMVNYVEFVNMMCAHAHPPYYRLPPVHASSPPLFGPPRPHDSREELSSDAFRRAYRRTAS